MLLCRECERRERQLKSMLYESFSIKELCTFAILTWVVLEAFSFRSTYVAQSMTRFNATHHGVKPRCLWCCGHVFCTNATLDGLVVLLAVSIHLSYISSVAE